jgi:predicted HTH transcriptional regulator
MSPEELNRQLMSLRALPHETEWVEFKHNDAEPEEVGEYISALSNSAALLGKEAGYIVWGIEDQTHRILGTSFKPRSRKVNGQEMESWLLM